MFNGFGESNRVLWFIILIISLWILLFPEVLSTSDCQ
jgi:hypothetical protein